MTLLSLLSSVSVDSITKEKHHLISVEAHASPLDALHLLKLHAIPVYGKQGSFIGAGQQNLTMSDGKQFIGILSLLDIVLFFLRQPLSKAKVFDLIGKSEEGRTLWHLTASTPLSVAVEMMSKGIHRILVECDNNDGTHEYKLLSQMDIIEWILRQRSHDSGISTFIKKILLDLEIIHDHPMHVDEQTNFHDALEFMAQKQLNAIAVTRNEILVETLSLSDIRDRLIAFKGEAILPNSITKGQMTVSEFLMVINRKLPVFCNVNDTLVTALELCVKQKIHRVWITHKQKLVGVVTLTDMLQAIFQA